MDGAEVYMLMIRKSGLPILGEAMAALPFYQQVEVLDWNWKIVNQDEVARRAKEDEETEIAAKSDTEVTLEFSLHAGDINDPLAEEAIQKIVKEVAGGKLTEREALRKIAEKQRQSGKKIAARANNEAKKDAQDQLDEFKKQEKQKELGNLEFSFSKRVDFASTQMLNCMKAGEILPRVVITIFHRSVSAPLNIVVTAKNLRFLKYELSVEVDETMADMKEDWEAEFSEISFSYTNTRGVDQQKGRLGVDALAGAKLARAAAQTTSLFVMKSRD